MKIEEFDRRFCIILLVFMFLASLIIGVGFLKLPKNNEDGTIMAMGTPSEEIQTLTPDKQAYDPVERAKEQMELERMIQENGCIVVIPETADTDEPSYLYAENRDGYGVRRRYYQLSLNNEQQDKVFDLCDQYDVPTELVFGIIQADATRIAEYGSGHAVMCLNQDSSSWYINTYKLTDINEFDQNITCGIIMLSEYYHRYPDVHKITMCYELGETNAVELWNSGITETEYSKEVALNINTLRLRE